MTVEVAFIRPAALGPGSSQVIGDVRATEAVSVPGTTTATVGVGELVMITNNESTAQRIAWGSTANADATVKTAATTAGISVPAGQQMPIAPPEGVKINVKAIA